MIEPPPAQRTAAASGSARVAAVVLNFNSYEATSACIHSLRELSEPLTGIIVVDNGSSSSVLADLRRLTGAEISLIESENNVGYGAGNNLGIRAALDSGAEYIWILNNDTTVESDVLGVLLDVARTSPPAVITPTILWMNSCRIWYRGGVYNAWTGEPHHRDYGLDIEIEHLRRSESVHEVGFVTGCSLFAPRMVFEKEQFIEDYFLYWEDIELSRRLREDGVLLLQVDRAVVRHHVGASSAASGGASATSYYYSNRNRLWFIRSHHRRARLLTALFWTPVFVLKQVYRIMVRERAERHHRLVALFRGVAAGLERNVKPGSAPLDPDARGRRRARG